MTPRCRRAVALTVLAAAITACGSTGEFGAPETSRSATTDRGTLAPVTTTAATSTSTSTTTTTTTSTSTSTTTTTTVPPTTTAPRPVIHHVMMAGDSVAMGEAAATEAAFEAGGIELTSIAYNGAGIMAAPDRSLDAYRDVLADIEPDVVLYQLSVWDRGTDVEQDAAYREFAALVTGTGAQLVFVTPPPMERPDEYLDLIHLRSLAAALASEQPGSVHLIDADVVWGSSFERDIGGDGVTDRMPDGVHICQGGAMRFADWVVGAFADLFDGFTAPDIAAWVFGTWNASVVYDVPVGACDPVVVSEGLPSDA